MKISLDWLKDYVDTGLAGEEIARILSDLGFPCEGIERLPGDVVLDVEVTSNRGDCLVADLGDHVRRSVAEPPRRG